MAECEAHFSSQTFSSKMESSVFSDLKKSGTAKNCKEKSLFSLVTNIEMPILQFRDHFKGVNRVFSMKKKRRKNAVPV